MGTSATLSTRRDVWSARPRGLTAWPAPRETGVWNPDVEVEIRDGKLVVRADLPGLAKENVKVDVTNDVLTIEGERKHDEEKKEKGYYRSERSYGRLSGATVYLRPQVAGKNPHR